MSKAGKDASPNSDPPAKPGPDLTDPLTLVKPGTLLVNRKGLGYVVISMAMRLEAGQETAQSYSLLECYSLMVLEFLPGEIRLALQEERLTITHPKTIRRVNEWISKKRN